MYIEQCEVCEKTEKLIESVYEVGILYQRIGKWDEAIRLLEVGIDLADDFFQETNLQKANLQVILAEILMRRGRYSEAEALLGNAVRVVKGKNNDLRKPEQGFGTPNPYDEGNYKEVLAKAFFALGELHYFLHVFMKSSEYALAMTYIEQARSLFEELGDLQGMSRILTRMGIMLDNQGDEKGARTYYEKAIALADEIDYEAAKALPLAHIGVIYNRQGDFEQALIYHEQALEISQRTEEADRIMHALGHIGVALYNLNGDITIALSKCKEALKIAEKLGHTTGMCLMLRRLGGLHIEAGHQEKARFCFERLVDVAEGNEFVNYIEIAKKRLAELQI